MRICFGIFAIKSVIVSLGRYVPVGLLGFAMNMILVLSLMYFGMAFVSQRRFFSGTAIGLTPAS